MFVPFIKEAVQNEINLGIKHIKDKSGLKILELVRSELQKDPLGQMLINECSLFKGFQTSIFNQKTQKHDITYVLENLICKDEQQIDKDQLREKFNTFEKNYDSLLLSNISPNSEIRKQNIQNIANLLKQGLGKIQKSQLKDWTQNVKDKILVAIAQIFAILTLTKSENYFDSNDLSNKNTFLLRPHAAQVIGIFRMLRLGELKKSGLIKQAFSKVSSFFFGESLINNLIEIKTGEGKSIVLGVTSCIFALLNCEVYCACYSEFLSTRDKNDFLEIFQILNIENNIHYGTFNELCEKRINKDFKLRNAVNELLLNKSNSISIKKKTKAQILLFDEIDTFFSTDFTGEQYSPITQLNSIEIEKLLDRIWAERKQITKFKDFMSLNEYKDVQIQLGKWQFLAEEALKDLITALHAYKTHDYKIVEGIIKYRNQDSYSSNQTYGYITLWAYYQEFENGKVSEATLKEHKYLMIKCGHFSYAEIPNIFDIKLGVTGTLQTLTEFQIQTIQEKYSMRQFTFLPSVFGKNDSKFNPENEFMVSRQEDYFNDIVKATDRKIANDRAVLIFFEDENQLNQFLDSPAFRKYYQQVIDQKSLITESLNQDERMDRVKFSTIARTITLLTKIFGRGTDFIVNDIKVQEHGGVHVIQVFFSDDIAEEFQIKGRTGRQGEIGSFQIIMNEIDVEKTSTQFKNLDLQRITYDKMNAERIKKHNQFIENSYKKIKDVEEDHKKSESLIESLQKNDEKNVKEILKYFNKGALRQKCTKTLMLLDATISMKKLFKKAKEKISQIIQRIQKILQENNIPIEESEIQIAVYRNYSSGVDNILNYSSWTSKYDELEQFLNNTTVSGGQGNEAIEIGFWHANHIIEQEKENIDQIILIGDAPPNTQKDITQNKKPWEEEYKLSKFSAVQHYQEELKNLISHNVQVHCYYVREKPKRQFEEIATQSVGQSGFLDVESDDGGENLAQIICQTILTKIGSNKGLGNKLAEQYKKYYS